MAPSRPGCGRSARLWAALALLAALLLSLIPASVAARELAIHANTATADFPNTITFTLEADAPGRVSQVELLYQPAFSPVTQVRRPDFSPGTHIDVSQTLDMRTHYLPPGIDILYRWRVELADGTQIETPEQTLFYMDQRFQWNTLQERQVTLYYYAGNESFGQHALDITIRAIDRFRAALDVTADEPMRVVIYGSNQDFADALPANSSEWIGGFADPEFHLIVTGIQPGPGSDRELRRVLTHEVIHLIMAQATENPFNSPPTWLNEGLASYYQEVPDQRFDDILHRAVESDEIIPIRALNSSFPDDPSRALLSYAESESIVHFILAEKGQDQLSDLVQVFSAGVAYDEAVHRALGITLDQLDQEWQAWLAAEGYRQTASAASVESHEAATADPGPITRIIDGVIRRVARTMVEVVANVWPLVGLNPSVLR